MNHRRDDHQGATESDVQKHCISIDNCRYRRPKDRHTGTPVAGGIACDR
jgi:hypothetical protein